MSQPGVFTRSVGAEESQGSSDLDLREYLSVLRRHKLMLLALAVLGLAAGYFRYSVTPRLYRATAVVRIDRAMLSAQISGIEPWLENWWNVEYYPTQYRLLRSRGLAEKVVEAEELASDPEFGGSVSPTAITDDAALAGLASRLLGGLTVDPIEKTQLVEIEYRASSPEFAARIANAFANEFINWGREERRTLSDNATRFLSDRIDELKGQIQETDRQLKERQVGENFMTLDAGPEAGETPLATLTASYTQAVRKRIEKEAVYRSILNADSETVAESEGGDRIGTLKSQLSEQERRYQSQLETYKEDWPQMVQLKGEIERSREDLTATIQEAVGEARERANSDYQAALREEQQLLSEIGRLRGEALQSSSKAVELSNLRRELENTQNQLEGVLESQSRTQVQSRLQADSQSSNVRIVDKAIAPGGPFQPDLWREISTGLGGGLFLGIAGAFLLNFLDRTIKTADEAEQVLGFPTLGVVIDLASNNRSYGYSYYGYNGRRGKSRSGSKDTEEVPIELVPATNPRMAVSESYRSIRAALLLSSAEELRAIAVTSASAGEGKSSTTVNLACVLAQLGRRVLLIDGDLRKPRQQQILSVSNRLGMVSCLTGNAEPMDIVNTTPIDNLYVVPAGPSSPNPSELLGSERMKEVLAYYQQSFDMVVFDTPPVLAVSDAVLIGSSCQGVIFCVRAGKTVREDAKAGTERLLMADVRVLGTVLNRYHHSTGSYKSQRYYQYYPYARADEADSAA